MLKTALSKTPALLDTTKTSKKLVWNSFHGPKYTRILLPLTENGTKYICRPSERSLSSCAKRKYKIQDLYITGKSCSNRTLLLGTWWLLMWVKRLVMRLVGCCEQGTWIKKRIHTISNNYCRKCSRNRHIRNNILIFQILQEQLTVLTSK